MRYTQQQYADYVARTCSPAARAIEGCDHEGELHAQIIQECKRRGWLSFHGSMAHKSKRTLGEPDFVLLLPGQVLFVECKTKTGKESPNQLAVKAMAARLGHTIHIVRSFPEFISLISLLGAKLLGISSGNETK